jgi:hypothetical protein
MKRYLILMLAGAALLFCQDSPKRAQARPAVHCVVKPSPAQLQGEEAFLVLCHTRFDLDHDKLERIGKVQGVSFVSHHSRYWFVVDVAFLFTPAEVMAGVLKELAR